MPDPGYTGDPSLDATLACIGWWVFLGLPIGWLMGLWPIW